MGTILHLLPGDPILPLFGLVFRCTYGSFLTRSRATSVVRRAACRPRLARREQINADLARVIAMALVPGVLQAFRSALEGLEGSERRLRSLVENSTDVVTVIGEDLTVQWQAEAIRGCSGSTPASSSAARSWRSCTPTTATS